MILSSSGRMLHAFCFSELAERGVPPCAVGRFGDGGQDVGEIDGVRHPRSVRTCASRNMLCRLCNVPAVKVRLLVTTPQIAQGSNGGLRPPPLCFSQYGLRPS